MAQASGGVSIGTVLLGCGCLGIVAVGAVLIAVVGFGAFTAKKLVDENKDEIAAGKEILKSLKKDSKDISKTVVKKAKSGKTTGASIKRESVWRWVQEPLTKDDVDKHIAFMSTWENTKSVKEFKAAAKKIKALSKKTKGKNLSTLEKMQAMGQGVSFYKNSAEALGEFDKVADAHGGGDAVLSRMFRIVALISAAESEAERSKKAPESDAVAAQLIKRKAGAESDYKKWKEGTRMSYAYIRVVQEHANNPEKLKAFVAKQKPYRKYTTLHTTDPGRLLLGKMPKESVEQWKGLLTAKRKSLVEQYSMMPSIPHWAFMPKSENTKLIAHWILAYDMLEAQKAMLGDGKTKPKTKAP